MNSLSILRKLTAIMPFVLLMNEQVMADNRPNIVMVIADDWSWPHSGAYGATDIRTPNIDKMAQNGIKFINAFCSASSCTPSRAALLTGRNSFELEQGATLNGYLPSKFNTYTDLLEKSGYRVGAAGKGWAPGLLVSRVNNPAGKLYNDITSDQYPDFDEEVSKTDYIANMEHFLNSTELEKPFCFWIGTHEPHRGYKRGFAEHLGIDTKKIVVPGFLPDAQEVRSDISEYYAEIQHIDKQIGLLFDMLARQNKLKNTLIVLTSDNGMPFPRAKATCYEYGVHMPLIMWWGKNIKKNRTITDIVSLIDLAPTFLTIAGIDIPEDMAGRSLLPQIKAKKSGRIEATRNQVVTCKERHGFGFSNGITTAARSIRTDDYLFIWNFNTHLAPKDVDNGPTKGFLEQNKEAFAEFYNLYSEPKKEYELYDLNTDKYQLINLAYMSKYQNITDSLKIKLTDYLLKRKDPRMTGESDKLVYIPHFGLLPRDLKVKKNRGIEMEMTTQEIFEILKSGYIKIGERKHYHKMMNFEKKNIQNQKPPDN